MPHLHLPLQSGSDSVLRRMARRCKTEEYALIVARLRAQIPHFNITTDIIVGFPDETQEEWQASMAFIEACTFGHIHIFIYSPREGTKAATLPNPVPHDIKKQRSEELHTLAKIMKQDFYTQNLNEQFEVLWEGQREIIDENHVRVFGYTPNYLRVACDIPSTQLIENTITPYEMKQVDTDYALGEIFLN
jgi:threonylcarbamoyladenosine tRNA methylthiotransferase MtaB